MAAEADHASRDVAEVGALLEAHKRLEAAHKELQVHMGTWHACMTLVY